MRCRQRPTAALADISIFLRDSVAENDVFVGAGGAIDRSDVRVTETGFKYQTPIHMITEKQQPEWSMFEGLRWNRRC